MKKRILSLLMAVVFCILSMGVVSVSADSITTITVGSVTVEPGDTIEVPVYISNNGDNDPDNWNFTGLMGLTLNIKYDANVLAYKSASQGDALSTLDLTKPGRDFEEGDLIFNWDSTDCDNSDGEILVIEFQVTANAPDGDYTIDVNVDAACDYDLMDVETRAVAGTVYVDETPPTTITVGDVETEQGAIVEVPVYISNNGDDDPDNANYTGLAGLILNFKYDTDVFAYKSATQGDMLSSLDITMPGRDFKEGDITFNWDSTDCDNTDGEILVIKFAVAEDAPCGGHTIDVTVKGACNFNLYDVETRAIDGIVTVISHKHTWNTGVITTQPTHIKTGVKTYTCSTCKGTKTETIPATGHTYGAWEKADDTYHKKTCSCGNITTASHYWYYSEVTTAATCKETGIRTYTCSTCNGTKTEVIPAKGHSIKIMEKVEPTCTKTGTKEHYKCSRCGEIFEDAAGTKEIRDIVIPALGHSYGAWVTDGYETHSKICHCGDVITEAHNWNTGIVTSLPTYRKTGTKIYTCSGCKGTKTETVAKLTATDSDTNITIGSAKVRNGKEITVPVTISNNVGIAGLQLMLEYNTDALTLIGVETGEALSKLDFTEPGDFDEDCLKFIWDGMEGDNANGEILQLKFKAKEDAVIGEYQLLLDADIACDEDLNDIPVYLVDGIVDVIEYTPGDPNDDGIVDVKDIIETRRYIAGGYGVTLLEKAADVDKDYSITVKDIINLRRFIAGGYGVELK